MRWNNVLVAIYSQSAQAANAAGRLKYSGFPVDQVQLIEPSRRRTAQQVGSAAAKESVASAFGRMIGAAAIVLPGVGHRLFFDQAGLTVLNGVDRFVDDLTEAAWCRWLQFVGLPREKAVYSAARLRTGCSIVAAWGSAQQVSQAEVVIRRTEPIKTDLSETSKRLVGSSRSAPMPHLNN
jgi:hypothetical protein